MTMASFVEWAFRMTAFPCQNQSYDSRVTLSSFCHMIAPQVKIEDEVLGCIEHLASLADPILAVASCQLDDFWSDVFQEFLSFFLT